MMMGGIRYPWYIYALLLVLYIFLTVRWLLNRAPSSRETESDYKVTIGFGWTFVVGAALLLLFIVYDGLFGSVQSLGYENRLKVSCFVPGWNLKCKNENAQLQKVVGDLKIKAKENRMVAENLPLFEEEVRKECRDGKEFLRTYPDKTSTQITADPPYFYRFVPTYFQDRALLDEYKNLILQIKSYEVVIWKVEALRAKRRICKN